MHHQRDDNEGHVRRPSGLLVPEAGGDMPGLRARADSQEAAHVFVRLVAKIDVHVVFGRPDCLDASEISGIVTFRTCGVGRSMEHRRHDPGVKRRAHEKRERPRILAHAAKIRAPHFHELFCRAAADVPVDSGQQSIPREGRRRTEDDAEQREPQKLVEGRACLQCLHPPLRPPTQRDDLGTRARLEDLVRGQRHAVNGERTDATARDTRCHVVGRRALQHLKIILPVRSDRVPWARHPVPIPTDLVQPILGGNAVPDEQPEGLAAVDIVDPKLSQRSQHVLGAEISERRDDHLQAALAPRQDWVFTLPIDLCKAAPYACHLGRPNP
mmetsp:Transcript_105161/g.322437  ORF Transcript_105161/g.322437 Transcript_105161/m.322437 type:complete len:327 (-) Transcript_105161:38-1018(-)